MVASAPSTRRRAPTESPVDAHAGGRVKKRPRLGVTRPTTALPFAASSLLAARRPPPAAAAAPRVRRERWACTACTLPRDDLRRRGAAAFPPEGHRGVPGGAGAPAVRRRVRGERCRLPGDPGARAGRLGRTGRPNRPPRAHHQRTQGAPPRAVVSKTCNYTTDTSREAESSVAASRLPQSHSPITLLARSRCDA